MATNLLLIAQMMMAVAGYYVLRGLTRRTIGQIKTLPLALIIAGFFTANWLILDKTWYYLITVNSITLLIILILIIEFKESHLNDNIFLGLAALGVTYHYLNNFEIWNLILMPLLNFCVAYITNTISKIFFNRHLFNQHDIKMITVSGFFLTIENVAFFYLMSVFFAILTALYWNERRLSMNPPLTASLAMSLYCLCLFGTKLDLSNLTLI